MIQAQNSKRGHGSSFFVLMLILTILHDLRMIHTGRGLLLVIVSLAVYFFRRW